MPSGFLAAIVESSHDAILSKDLDGVITSWNHGAEALFGYTEREVVGRSVTMLIPPDRLDEEPAILARIRRGEAIDHYETVRRRKDGSLVDISLTVSPIRRSDGAIVGASKIARDISDRRRASEQAKLMLQEMQHRTKNLAAVIDALARQSKPVGAPAIDDFLEVFLGRVHALLSTGELVVATAKRQADLRQVVETALSPFSDPARAHSISLDGPPLSVSERTAGGLALALHELATNALKYGALKVRTGKVSIGWTAKPEEDGTRVRIEWKETGGEPLRGEPERNGFGSRLIRAAVSGERDGTTTLSFEPDGLRCRFAFTATAPSSPSQPE
jgi:PAS domain S-box-containing protein